MAQYDYQINDSNVGREQAIAAAGQAYRQERAEEALVGLLIFGLVIALLLLWRFRKAAASRLLGGAAKTYVASRDAARRAGKAWDAKVAEAEARARD